MLLNLFAHYLTAGVFMLVFGTVGAIRTREFFALRESLWVVLAWPGLWVWSFKNKRERIMMTFFVLTSSMIAYWFVFKTSL